MVTIRGTYEGDLRCEAVHEPSGTAIRTDAPADNQGRGELFSPTDLVAAALGTCVVTTMAIVAKRHGIDLGGPRWSVEKHMVSDPGRRIGRLPVTVWLPARLDPRHRALLERAAHACPVHRSLGVNVDAPIEFVYE